MSLCWALQGDPEDYILELKIKNCAYLITQQINSVKL